MLEMNRNVSTNYTIEVEVTNFCNAKCVFCANQEIIRPRGFLKLEDFARFVRYIDENKKNNIFYRINNKYPRITFCGLGDPLIHPEIDRIVNITHNAGCYTQLVTNGHLLTPEKLRLLIDSGLDELSISIHTINDDNYRAITGLEVSDLKKALAKCKSIFEKREIKISIWRVKHPNPIFVDSRKDEIEFEKFICENGLTGCDVLGPSEPWSRDGYVKDSRCTAVNDTPFWCNKIVFTMNIDWQGNLVICCNDYNYEREKLGNIFDDDFLFGDYMRKKMEILYKKHVPELCKRCRRWPDDEIFDILKQEKVDANMFFEDLYCQLKLYR